MSSTSLSGPFLVRSGQRGGLRRRLRVLADAAVTPLTLDDVLDNFHPLRSGTDLRGRIVTVQPETADAAPAPTEARPTAMTRARTLVLSAMVRRLVERLEKRPEE